MVSGNAARSESVHLGHSVKAGGAGPYDRYIDLSLHLNVFLLLQKIILGN